MNILIKLKNQIESLSLKVEIPPPEIEADLAIPCFKLDKNEVVKKIKNLQELLILNTEIVGNYINIIVDKNLLAQNLFEEVEKEKDNYGKSAISANQKIIIEFSDPNIAKPLNVGHFRSTMIGQALVNLYRWQGYEVIAINHLGDWGTQFGKLILAYQKWGADEKDLFKLYVRFHQEVEKNPQLDDEARQIFKKLEQGDLELIALWKKITDESIVEFDKLYKELGVKFDHIIGESFYKDLAKTAIQEALVKGVAEKSEGAIVVPESKTGLPTFVIQKSDESSIYASRDLAAAKDRLDKWHPEKIIYVVGSEQNLYFKQIFKTLELLGYDVQGDCLQAPYFALSQNFLRELQKKLTKILCIFARFFCSSRFPKILRNHQKEGLEAVPKKFLHVSLGLVILPEGKMSTRQGKIVLLEDLIKESIKKTRNLKPETRNLKEEDIKTIAYGALVYNALSSSPEKTVVFDWQKMLSSTGASAPYIQYGYVRAKSIVNKISDFRFQISDLSNIDLSSIENKLVKLLALFPETCRQAQQLNAPHLLATYLNNLVQEFNRFYATEKVLEAEEENLKIFRLQLVSAFAQVIKNGLNLLNINVPEKM